MSSIKHKIKEALTAHHDDKDSSHGSLLSSVTPRSLPSSTTHLEEDESTGKHPETPAGQQYADHYHHDPEPKTKQATRDAGNHPYWGDLPHASAPGSGAAVAGHLASRDVEREDIRREGILETPEESDLYAAGEVEPSGTHSRRGRGKDTEGDGAHVATHVAVTDKPDREQDGQDAAPKPLKPRAGSEREQTTSVTEPPNNPEKPVEAATPTRTTSEGDNNVHREEAATLAAGAGAGAGAEYYVSQNDKPEQDTSRESELPSTTSSTAQEPTQSVGSASHDESLTEAEKATSAAGNYPHWGTNGRRSHHAADNHGDDGIQKHAGSDGASVAGARNKVGTSDLKPENDDKQYPREPSHKSDDAATAVSHDHNGPVKHQATPPPDGDIHNPPTGPESPRAKYLPLTPEHGRQLSTAQAAAQQAWQRQEKGASSTAGNQGPVRSEDLVQPAGGSHGAAAEPLAPGLGGSGAGGEAGGPGPGGQGGLGHTNTISRHFDEFAGFGVRH